MNLTIYKIILKFWNDVRELRDLKLKIKNVIFFVNIKFLLKKSSKILFSSKRT